MLFYRRNKKVCLTLFFLWSFMGCAYGNKAIPDDLRHQVTPALPFKEVIRDPRASIGSRVIWGGTIIKTTVSQKGTMLEILQKPLDHRDKPHQTDNSGGRFLVEQVDAFLDPAVYKEGREITIFGELTETREQSLGEMVYRYPYVVAAHVHLWKAERFPRRRNYYAGYPYWAGYPYDPYFPYPYRHRPFLPRRHGPFF